MSLTVYLVVPKNYKQCVCEHCGNKLDEDDKDEILFQKNITHNLNQMAMGAGLYYPLWSPEEIGIKWASQLINQLRAGLDRLLCNREVYLRYNPSNGWGDYDSLVEFVKSYLEACEKNPEAIVQVSK